jgi:serine protease Do
VSALFSAALLGSVVAFAPFADAAEPSAMPPSLAAVAQAARAASIVVRNAEEEDVATSVLAQDESDRDEGDIVASRRRTVAAGIIVDPRGYALTNARAVLRVRNFEIALIDGVVVKATLVGLDRPTDMALLKLEPPDSGGALPYLVIGDSARANVGDWVIAIGAPRGFEGTVTAGIITALPAPGSRSPVAGFIQTDAAMSRGSAGGALVTATGEVIGLLSVLSGDGIGYVVPSTTVRRIYLELLETGHVSRPWLGAQLQSLTPALARALGARDAAGVLIADISVDSPAVAGGLRSGDIVVDIDGSTVSSPGQLERAIGSRLPGHVTKLRVRRDGRELVASVMLGEEPVDWKLPPALARIWRLLGIEARRITPTMGAIAVRVDPSSSAALAGIEPGDIIREVDRRTIRNLADLEMIAAALRPGAEVPNPRAARRCRPLRRRQSSTLTEVRRLRRVPYADGPRPSERPA